MWSRGIYEPFAIYRNEPCNGQAYLSRDETKGNEREEGDQEENVSSSSNATLEGENLSKEQLEKAVEGNLSIYYLKNPNKLSVQIERTEPEYALLKELLDASRFTHDEEKNTDYDFKLSIEGTDHFIYIDRSNFEGVLFREEKGYSKIKSDYGLELNHLLSSYFKWQKTPHPPSA